MNREIKFKIWDKEEKKFFEPVYEAYKGSLVDISISMSGALLRRTLEMPCEHESRFPNRYTLLQYTGLKDKNGKDIYFGDIITSPISSDTPWEVKQNGAYISPLDNYLIQKDCVVIGNIYEHPNLIAK